MNEKFYQLPCGRREKIIRSAYQVFSRNEYKRASMSAIADAAGISKSLLFYYFKNKKELYLYLVCHAENLTRSAVQEYGVWETEDLFEMLRRNVRAKSSLSVKYPEICMFSVKAYYEQHPEVKKDVHKLIAKTNQNAEQKFLRTFDNSMFREDIETETMYYEIALACEGYLYRCFQKGQIDIGRMEEEFDVLIKHWKKVYLRRWK